MKGAPLCGTSSDRPSSGHDAEYVELRLEDAESTRLQYRGKDLEEANRTRSKGGCARALVNGGWGFVSFNSYDDLAEKVRLAVRQARIAGNETSAFAPAPPVDESVAPRLVKDPRGGLPRRQEGAARRVQPDHLVDLRRHP